MTNQASEDALRAEILTEFKQAHKLAPADYTESCTNIVMSLIRTEKLKLLAEVRERVVGDDHLLFGHGEDWEGAEPQNSLKQEQREALNKLEAEL